eukprot:1471573-Amphidinium_carterae.1
MFFFSTRNPVTGPMMGGDTHQSMSSPEFTFQDEPCRGQTMMSPTMSAPEVSKARLGANKIQNQSMSRSPSPVSGFHSYVLIHFVSLLHSLCPLWGI